MRQPTNWRQRLRTLPPYHCDPKPVDDPLYRKVEPSPTNVRSPKTKWTKSWTVLRKQASKQASKQAAPRASRGLITRRPGLRRGL
jgi:hypothetical protein